MAKVNRQTIITDKDTQAVVTTRQEDENWFYLNDHGYLLHHKQRPILRIIAFPLPDMTGDHIIKFMRLTPYIRSGNALMRLDRPGHPLAIKQFIELLLVSRGRAYSFLKDMQDIGLLRKVDDTFYVNPRYLMVGSRLTAKLYAIFEDELADMVPPWVQDKFREDGA